MKKGKDIYKEKDETIQNRVKGHTQTKKRLNE